MRDISLPCFDKVGQLLVGQGVVDNGRSVIYIVRSPGLDPRFVDYGEAP